MLPWWLPLAAAAAGLMTAPWWMPHLPPALAPYADLLAPAIAVTLAVLSLVLGLRAWRRGRALRAARNHRSLARLTWREFEVLVAELYRRQGHAASVTPDGADGGIDVLVESRHGRTIVQAKHWPHRTVGVAVVRELYALLEDFDADSGAVVTSGRLSPEASAFAADKPIALLDGDAVVALAQALRRRHPCLSVAKSEVEDSSDEEDAESVSSTMTIVCPHCSAEIEFEYPEHG